MAYTENKKADGLDELTSLDTGDLVIVADASDSYRAKKITKANILDTPLSLKANIDSQTFTGTPVLPTGTIGVTQSASDNSTKLATTAYVDNQVQNYSPNTGYSTTEVFSGTPPTSFTDLNLSSVIGVNMKIVLLKIYDSSASMNFFTRPNGDSSDYTQGSPATTGAGVHAARLANGANNACMVICKTDSNGVIEWMTNNGSSTVKIAVLAYW